MTALTVILQNGLHIFIEGRCGRGLLVLKGSAEADCQPYDRYYADRLRTHILILLAEGRTKLPVVLSEAKDRCTGPAGFIDPFGFAQGRLFAANDAAQDAKSLLIQSCITT